jgi:hypothetical protein
LKSRDLETVMSPAVIFSCEVSSVATWFHSYSLTHRPSHIFCAVCVTTCYEMGACFVFYTDESSNAEESRPDSVSANTFWVKCISRTVNFILILFLVHEKKKIKQNEAKAELSLWPSSTPWNGDWHPDKNSNQILLGSKSNKWDSRLSWLWVFTLLSSRLTLSSFVNRYVSFQVSFCIHLHGGRFSSQARDMWKEG